jgi:hypothetical protein
MVMKLFRIVAGAQGGRAFANMAQAFGLSDEMSAQIVRYLIPPIAKSIQKRAQTAEGLLSVLEFLGSRRFDRFLDDPRVFGHPKVLEEGERVIDYAIRSKAQVKKIIERRAQVLPIKEDQIEKLFPFVAVMAMGAIEARTRRPLGTILHRLNDGVSDARAIANPYLALAQMLRKKEREERDTKRRQRLRVSGVLGSLVSRSPAPAPQRLALPAA